MLIHLNVNGQDYDVDAAPGERLLDTLRERLHITSVKRGCENGDCGACTVLLDGRPIASCIFLTVKARNHRVQTIEAFGEPGRLHPLQEKFRVHGAFQCGFCAPGVTLSAISLLNRNPAPTEEEIRRAISGNLCRCSGYVQIVEAIKDYAEERRRGTSHEES